MLARRPALRVRSITRIGALRTITSDNNKRVLAGFSVRAPIPTEEECGRLLTACAAHIAGPFDFLVATGLQHHNEKAFKIRQSYKTVDAKTVQTFKQALDRLPADTQSRISVVLLHELAAKHEYAAMVKAARAALDDSRNQAFYSAVHELATAQIAKRKDTFIPGREAHVIDHILNELPSCVSPVLEHNQPFRRLVYATHERKAKQTAGKDPALDAWVRKRGKSRSCVVPSDWLTSTVCHLLTC